MDGCDSSHPEEEVGWIAVELGNEPFEQPGEAKNLSNEIASSNWASTSFGASFSERPVGFFAVQNNDGGQDPKVDEIRNVDTSGMEMRFCELEAEGSGGPDTCDGHIDMEYAYLAVEEGLLTYSNGNFPRYVDDSERGKVLEFDGVDDGVDIENSVYYSKSSVTVGAWIKQTGTVSSPYQRVTDGELTYWVDDRDGDTCVRLTADEGGGSTQTCFNTGLQKNKWYHLLFTYDSSTSETKLYLDGELFGTSSYYSGSMDDSSNNFAIGNNDGGSRPWKGKIDDIRIYPYALNDEQVKQVMKS